MATFHRLNLKWNSDTEVTENDSSDVIFQAFKFKDVRGRIGFRCIISQFSNLPPSTDTLARWCRDQGYSAPLVLLNSRRYAARFISDVYSGM